MIKHRFEGSEALQSAKYDEDTATLDVRFCKGPVYRYFLVPRRIVMGLIDATSCGRYFVSEIRG